jgi:hypothetical protein
MPERKRSNTSYIKEWKGNTKAPVVIRGLVLVLERRLRNKSRIVLEAARSRFMSTLSRTIGSPMKKQARITKKSQTPKKPEKVSPFEKYRGIGNGGLGPGREAVVRAIRELRGR